MGVFEDSLEKVASAESGRAAILEFPHIESDPAPTVIWQDENGVLRYDQKYAISDKHQLIILCASHEDERAYRYVKIKLTPVPQQQCSSTIPLLAI